MGKRLTLFVVAVTLLGSLGGFVLAHLNSQMLPRNSDVSFDSIPHGMHRMASGALMSDTGEEAAMHHMGMMVSTEREFIEEMIPHHQEAVDTAKEVLERGGTTPEVRNLVEGIIQAQEAEIAMMKEWYQTWYGISYEDDRSYVPMMRDLEPLSGADLDRAFLSDMIMHHMGAIMMARSVTPYIEHEEVRSLTKAIVESQTDEIAQMRRLLITLN